MGPARRLVQLLLLALLAAVQAGRNYYEVLQVSKTADEATIKRAYRKLAVKWHPDKNQGDEEANARFAEINNGVLFFCSYEVLSDPSKRRVYDVHGEEGVKQHSAGGGGGSGNMAQDIFSQFFGGFGGFGGGDGGEPETPKGRTVTVELQVTLRDLYLGRVFQVVRDKAVYRPAKGTRKCNCKTRMTTRQIAPGMYQQIPTQQCEQCPGMALGRESETLRVEVEKGSQDGTEISFFEQGEPLLDGEPGDLRFRLVTVDASGFVRTGHDLALDVSLTLAEALVGFTKQVTHLDGHQVELSREGVTSHGEVQRVRGQGMPHAHAHTKFGDLLVKYHIQMPEALDDKQKATVRTLFARAKWLPL